LYLSTGKIKPLALPAPGAHVTDSPLSKKIMTFAKEKILDDIARAAGGTVSVLSGLSRQVRQDVRARIDDAALKMDLVPRAEFERLEAVLREAREEQQRQNARIDALEKALGENAKSKKGKSA
jgi:BMFP domain-containing protein YqiC